MERISDRRFYLILVFTYFFSWGWMLLNIDGIYWDDWTLVGHPMADVLTSFDQNGHWLASALHSVLLNFKYSVFVYHFLVFISFGIVGIAFYKVLSCLDFFDIRSTRVIALIAIVFPVNHARIAMITLPYSVCLALFFVAWLILLQSLRLNDRLLRVFSYVLFFLSFTTQSLLVFFVIPLAQVFWLQYPRFSLREVQLHPRVHWKTICTWGLFNLDLLCLPIFFLGFTKMFFTPSGLYAKYNVITLKGLRQAVPESFNTIYTSIIEPVIESVIVFPFYGYLVFLGLLVFVLFFKSSEIKEFGKDFYVKNILVVFLGLITFILGVFPYNAVYKMPMLQDWESRHQLLVSFGASLAIYGFFELFSRFYYKYKFLLYFSLISILSYSNAYALNDYYWDWIKQESIIENLKRNSNIMLPFGNAFIFRDNFTEFNAKNRSYRFYELSGFLKNASGDESRFGVLVRNKQRITEWKKFRSHYNINDYRGGDVLGLVTITKGEHLSKSILSMAGLFVDRISDHELYLMRVQKYSQIDFALFD